MKKIILLISTSVVIIAQIFVLAQFFVNRYSIVLGGDKLKFLVSQVDLTCAREDGYIDIELKERIGGKGDYGIIHIDENGFAELERVATTKPSFGMYIKSSLDGYFYFPLEKYYIDLDIEYDDSLVLPQDYKAYINVRIKEGKIELMDMLIDGEPVEKYCK